MFNRDQLTNIDRGVAAQAAFAVIDRVQGTQPGTQIAGMALSFLLMCEHLKVSPQDVFTVAGRLLNDDNNAFGQANQFQAIRDYMANEL